LPRCEASRVNANMNNIYIVGFMGTGKTSLARRLSGVKKLAFIDLDELIQTSEKKSITEIFSQKGEVYFRALEKNILAEVSRKDDQVVSCGGGIVLDKDNIVLMKNSGIIICLSARPEVILARTKNYQHRPLLNVDDPEKKIKELLEARANLYALADHKIDTSDISLKEVVIKALELIK
jgi:shikimate kinase